MTKAKTPAPEAETTAEDQTPPPSGQTATPDQTGADFSQEEAARAEAERAEAERVAAEKTARAEAERQAAEAAAQDMPQLNLQALTYCARQIDMLNTGGHRLGLVDELTQLYRAEIGETEAGFTVSIEGITTEPADSLETALTNWANAARRACAEAVA